MPNHNCCRVILAAMVCSWTAGIGSSPAEAAQAVYLDFDTIKDAYDLGGPGPGIPPAYQIFDYTAPARTLILSYLTDRYGAYGLTFHDGLPAIPGTASVITLNKGSGGGAEKIDFRNLDDDDSADINAIAALEFVDTGPIGPPYPIPHVLMATSNLVAHEVEHLMGVQHHDAFGPIGMGIGAAAGTFSPAYPGPALPIGGPETGMAVSSLTTGMSLSYASLTSPHFVSERAVVKLTLSYFGSEAFVTPETGAFHNAVPDAQGISLIGFSMPYPLRPFPSFTHLVGSMAVVTGTISESTIVPGVAEADYYTFFAVEGQAFTIEIISEVLDHRLSDTLDTIMWLLNDVGAVVPYHSSSAFNDDGFGTTASQLIDVIIPATGMYVVEIGAKSGMLDLGSYELLIYTVQRVMVIPEPGVAALLLGLGVAGLCVRRARR